MIKIRDYEISSMVFSYLVHRKIIGILGMSLPFILLSGALIFFQTGIQSSISSYYYTGMRNVFVGILFVISFFLFSYKGYNTVDNIFGNLACVFGIGLALFPTAPDGVVTQSARIIGYVHFAFAALFFFTLIYFSLFLFTKTVPNKLPKPKKKIRNRFYKACGYIMAVCILLIGIYTFLSDKTMLNIKTYKLTFVFEALAIISFGVSWYIKGEAILKD